MTDDETPVGDTPEAHDELSPHDIPKSHPAYEDVVQQAGGTEERPQATDLGEPTVIGRPRIDGHRQSVERPQRDRRIEHHLRPGDQVQRVALGDHRREDHPLHHREPLSHADPPASTEREVRVSRTGIPGLADEPPRVETRRVGPDRRIPVGRPGRDQHDRPLRDQVTPEHVVPQGPPLDVPDRRVQAHRLLKAGLRPRQPVRRVRARPLTPENLVDLRQQLVPDGRVLRQEVEHPAQAVRRRLVARRNERHQLVAHLDPGHRLAGLLVARVHQQAEQVLPPAGDRSSRPPLDQSVDDLIHQVYRRRMRPPTPELELERPLGGDPRDPRSHDVDRRPAGRADLMVGGSRRRRERRVQHADVPPEQRTPDDLERHLRHLRRRVDLLAPGESPVPRPERRLRRGDHVLGERDQMPLGEHRRDQRPLALPRLPLVGDQAPPQQPPHQLVDVSLHVVVLVGDQDVLDLLGPPDDEQRSAEDLQQGDIPVDLRDVVHRLQRVPADHRQHPGQVDAPRAGRPRTRRPGRRLPAGGERPAGD